VTITMTPLGNPVAYEWLQQKKTPHHLLSVMRRQISGLKCLLDEHDDDR